MQRDACAIVIHHNNYPQVMHTVDDLLAAGFSWEQLLVVDNSSDDSSASSLAASVPPTSLLRTANEGYGAAANAGLHHLRERNHLAAHALIVTHDVRIDAESVGRLRAAMDEPQVVAAGPSITNSDNGLVWSLGGSTTRAMKHPRHIVSAGSEPAPVIDRSWLDGACVMYRVDAIGEAPFLPEFFLYFEEAELHHRLRAAGHRVVWVPTAQASQRTDGAPPYYRGRNLHLFLRHHGTRAQRLLSVPVLIAGAVARSVAHRTSPSDALDMARGFRDAWRVP